MNHTQQKTQVPAHHNQNPSFFLDCLYLWAKTKPDTVFLSQTDQSFGAEYTWSDVKEQAEKIASHLRVFPRRSKIAIYSKNCAQWVMADFAIQMAGMISVPIYATHSEQFVKNAMNHSDAVAVFIGALDHPISESLIPKGIQIYSMHDQYPGAISWSQLLATSNNSQSSKPVVGDEIATIIYTSGTNSDPKGVMLSLNALQTAVTTISGETGVSEQDSFMSYLPLAHVSERVRVALTAVSHGCRITFADPQQSLSKNLKTIQPTLFFSVPQFWIKLQISTTERYGGDSQFKRMLSIPFFGKRLAKKVLKKAGLQSIRHAICAAAPIPKYVLEWFSDIGIQVNQAYGLTETCSLSHMTMKGNIRFGSVGQPFKNSQVKIGKNKEILVKSPSLFSGYHKNEELTQDSIDKDGWFHTGDIGRIDEDQFLFIEGRISDSFKSNDGQYIFPGIIESALQQHINIDHIVVLGINKNQPVAIMSVYGLHEIINEVQLMLDCLNAFDQVNAKLQPHEKISHIFITDEPWRSDNECLTSSGKPRRKYLKSHYISMIEKKLLENQNNKGTVLWFDQ